MEGFQKYNGKFVQVTYRNPRLTFYRGRMILSEEDSSVIILNPGIKLGEKSKSEDHILTERLISEELEREPISLKKNRVYDLKELTSNFGTSNITRLIKNHYRSSSITSRSEGDGYHDIVRQMQQRGIISRMMILEEKRSLKTSQI